MNSSTAIKVEQLSKSYYINDEQHASLRSQLANIFKPKTKRQLIWALSDINFEIEKGQATGIIGPNGAGKSTLLKILSKITYPTKGKATLHGRVSSLLEVGTGFHPELTGRENIYLNGSLLGMSKGEITKNFDDIISFAEISKFVDTPVKRYSSGMYTRLAFSVAAHLKSDILLIDEVLAVGDYNFRKKCLSKMDSITKEGKTILYVSHNLDTVQQLCTNVLLIRNGKLEMAGNPFEVTSYYLEDNSATSPFSGNYIRSLTVSGKDSDEIHVNKECQIRLTFKKEIKSNKRLFLRLEIKDKFYRTISILNNRLINQVIEVNTKTELVVSIKNLALEPGPYYISVRLISDSVILDESSTATPFVVSSPFDYVKPKVHTVVSLDYNFHTI